MKFVSLRTGLSVHTIRIWEKRYGVVRPVRAPNNRRLYSEREVERLDLLRQATAAGHGIGQIARAPLSELRRLVKDSAGPKPRRRSLARSEVNELAQTLTSNALAAIESFDGPALDALLDRAAVELGSPAVLQKFVAPLAERVGDCWRDGDFKIAHEHFATDHITDFLGKFARPYSENISASHLVVATPTGQLHELGAIIAAAAARSHGWRTTYLGAGLPIQELAGAVQNLRPRAVALSIVFPPNDTSLAQDLRKLRRLLPKECALIVGGRSAAGYERELRQIKAIHVEKLEALYPVLDKLARSRKS
jgi:DNA-binding transcriptional MerR regulator/methylmalonyl-CoA mutase cobalamin-binding subunit